MKQPQQDNQEPKASQKTKKNSRLIRYSVLVFFTLLGVGLLGYVVLRFGNVTGGHDNTVDKPITDVLNMADQHKLKSVLISGNDVLATAANGRKYHAIKEDGQPVTDTLRRDGVTVTIDNGQSGQWTTGLIDLLLIGLIIGSVYFFI